MMNNRGHLPAGQQHPMQPGADIVVGGGPGPGPRRGGRSNHGQYYHGSHYQPQHNGPMNPAMYAPNQGYMNPYAAPYYMPAPAYQQPPHIHPSYMGQYPSAPYSRSPPSMQQQYAPMNAALHPAYSRPHQQHSPIVQSPYQVPPPHLAQSHIPPSVGSPTPSSTHSFAPPPMSPQVQQFQEIIPGPLPVPVQAPVQVPVQVQPMPVVELQLPVQPEAFQPVPEPEVAQPVPPAIVSSQTPSDVSAQSYPILPPAKEASFRFPVPWYTHPDEPFPARTKNRRRRKLIEADSEDVEITRQQAPSAEAPTDTQKQAAHEVKDEEEVESEKVDATPKPDPKVEAVEPLPPRSETPSTHDHRSEDTAPTTPSSVQPSQHSSIAATTPTKPVKPAVPVIPVIPKAAPQDVKPGPGVEKTPAESKPPAATQAETKAADAGQGIITQIPGATESTSTDAAQPAPAVQHAPGPSKPKLWAGLFSKPSTSVAPTATAAPQTHIDANGTVAEDSAAAAAAAAATTGTVGGFPKTIAATLAEALHSYHPGPIEKLPFLEPRGLVNTGNMCYMNSVLQVLIYCLPFYDFLDQVGKKAAHSFKSDTPLIDAMIMFMREFKIIDSAASIDLLRRRLKPEELEQYGDSFTPEFVYEAIRKLPRFASMRRGHQQDAQEFLGFLLEGLHDECTHVMRAAPVSTASTAPNSSASSPTLASKPEGADDWLEVGPRQRAAVTRSSGHSHTQSPINKIFGGHLRSELRVPGNKNSVTLEPYQPLQLDIGAPEIRNIIDALKGLTRPETLYGDFNSPHGKNVKATKQLFIESVPPVLILHLKRFQFDAEGQGGTVKIWKKVGYPLEFEFPQEVLSRSKRNSILAENTGTPKYRLVGVVYHHGKNASGGHYTVDVRRQDGREWIRIDDTIIRRVRSEDVAEGGAEEDMPKTGVNGQKDAGSSNRFGAMNDDDTGDDDGWKQAVGGKKWSSVVNGANAAPATNGQKAASKVHKENMKDNKVAYLLFYQRI
ncbi:hypothetical protein QBC44DRAFT_137151 [Cladorrhinum sp. PSN332]|nr:hypothetical protein QBC44DRAFT_137151 [Cladorrhinum sp. PSN332]